MTSVRGIGRRVTAALLALALACAACGDDDDAGGSDAGDASWRDGGRRSERDAAQSACEPARAEPVQEALAFERALIERGRADAELAAGLGKDGEALLARADQLRTELVREAARDQDIELPEAASASVSCSDGGIAVARQPLALASLFAFGMSVGQLAAAVASAPLSGSTPSRPYMSEEAGMAADGTPTQTFITMDLITSGQRSSVTVTTTVNTSVWKGTFRTTETASIIATIDVCPDAAGLAKGNVHMVADGSSSDGASYHAETSDDFNLVVNDAAELDGIEVMSMVAYRSRGPTQTDVASRGSVTLQEGSFTTSNASGSDVRNDGSAESQRFVRDNLYRLGIAMAVIVRSPTRSKWRSGTCVEVVPEPANQKVDPGTQLTLKATAKHKFETRELSVPIVATLSGVKTLSPQNAPVMSPAEFDYVAGGEFKDLGTIAYKSTSKRGIGEATAAIEVQCDEHMMCPEPKQLNTEICECECPERRSCTANQAWNEDRCACECTLLCPTGQTLDRDACRCETACEIDPSFFVASQNECKLVGTLHISANDGGQWQEPGATNPTINEVWSFSYQAALAIENESLAGPVLRGAINGDWQLTRTNTFSAPASCMTTETEAASITTSLDGEGALAVTNTGTPGMFVLSAFFGIDKSALIGTRSSTASGDPCTAAEPSELSIFGPSVSVTGPASGSSFTGTQTITSSIYQPDGTYAEFDITWDIGLVRR